MSGLISVNEKGEPVFEEIDPEILSHMPRSFQMFYEIQKEAWEEVQKIKADVDAGKTTWEQVKRERGIL